RVSGRPAAHRRRIEGARKLTMSFEGRAALIAAVVALVILGAFFGLAALMRSATGGAATSSSPSAAATSAVAAAGADRAATEAAAAVFAKTCSSCHGDNGPGGFAPALHKAPFDAARIARIIPDGNPPRMPAYGDKLTPESIQQITAYAVSR